MHAHALQPPPPKTSVACPSLKFKQFLLFELSPVLSPGRYRRGENRPMLLGCIAFRVKQHFMKGASHQDVMAAAPTYAKWWDNVRDVSLYIT